MKSFQKVCIAMTVCLAAASIFTCSAPAQTVNGKSKDQKAKTLVAGNFSSGIFINDLGGNFGGDEEKPGLCTPSLIANPEIVLGRSGYSLELDYDVSELGSYSFFWMKLGRQTEGQNDVNEKTGLERYNYLSMYVKGENSKENFKIEMHKDTDGDGRFIFGKDTSSGVYAAPYLPAGITKEWQKVVIPLKDFKEIKDWKNMIELVIVFENRMAPVKKSSVYVDNIVFGSSSVDLAEIFNKTILPKEPLKGTFKIEGAVLTDNFVCEDMNNVSVQASSAKEDPSMENVRFEFSSDNGKKWTTIGADYDTSKNVYSGVWSTFGLACPGCYDLRAVAVDIKGNEAISVPVYYCTIRPMTDEEFLDVLERKAFDFFWDNQDTVTGLFRDTSGGGNASTASTGFGLTALCIGVERGWADREEAKARAVRAIKTFLPNPQEPGDIVAEGRYGFFYHFLNMNTAMRSGTSEISTVDTALLICGAITAGDYFGAEVKLLANELYAQVDWTKFLIQDEGPDKNLFSMGWSPERGVLGSNWDYYTDEGILINLLAIGSPTHPVFEDVFYAWTRKMGSYGEGEPYVVSWHGALFAHQYAQAWFYLKDKIDRDGIDWYKNSRAATLANREFCIDHMSEFRTYGPDSWGVTSMSRPEAYTMHHGVPPTGSGEAIYDGTVSPTGPAGSMAFTPYLSLRALKNFYHKVPKLWGKYGLRDSFNMDLNWYAPVYYGIGEGIFLLGIENFRSGLIWNNFMKNEYVAEGIKKAGFSEELKMDYELPPANFTDIEGIKGRSLSPEAVIETFEKAIAKCRSQKDFIALTGLMDKYVTDDPDFKYKDRLVYLSAKTILAQLKVLIQKDDLDSGRLYIKENDRLYTDALRRLTEVTSGNNTDKTLVLDAEYLLFSVYREQFDYEKQDRAFEGLVNIIDTISDDEKVKMFHLNRIVAQLNQDGLFDHGLKMRVLYASKLGKVATSDLINSIKNDADELFDAGNYVESKAMHDKYAELIVANLDANKASSGIIQLGDQYFTAKKYTEAIGYYQGVIDKFKNNNADYCSYKKANALRALENYEDAIGAYKQLLAGYRNSEYFNKAYSELARLYYVYYKTESAINSINGLLAQYPNTRSSDYLHFFLGLLYYQMSQYDFALKETNSIINDFKTSTLLYAASVLRDELVKVKSGEEPSRYSYEGEAKYRMWHPNGPTGAELALKTGKTGEWVKKEEFKPLEITVKPGQKIGVKLENIKDNDFYSEYLKDLEDESRLPRKTKEDYEEDFLALDWMSGGDGKFLNTASPKEKVWVAPNKEGTYNLNIELVDLALVKVFEKGERKEPKDLVLGATLIVKGRPSAIAPWKIVSIWALIMIIGVAAIARRVSGE